MGSVFLTWKENNTDEDGHRVYRSLTPIDPEAPPTPLASLGPDVTSYQDTTALEDVTYYYRVSAYKSGVEVFSPQLEVYTDPNAPTSIIATGGVVSDIEVEGISYRVHTFTSSDTFTVSAGAGDVDYLIVGGGGSGGRNNVGGGGGGGGVVTGTLWRTPGSYPVIVGAGGIATPNTEGQGYNGEDSSVFGVVAFGGGGGGAGGSGTNPLQLGLDGGSGGGGGGTWNSSRAATGGAGTSGQGYGGGTGINNASTSSRASGGGGGAGQAGANAGDGVGGKGGDGVQSSITGTATYYGGGGGGGSNGGTRGLGGLGGGGAGGRSGQICVDGTPNTGGGGGGRSETTPPDTSAPGASGGSGIVIVRYRLFGGA